MNDADIARLRAEAAEAAAKAARAEAELAQARLDAALAATIATDTPPTTTAQAASDIAGNTPTENTTETATAAETHPPVQPAASSPQDSPEQSPEPNKDDYANEVARSYQVAGPALTLGAYLDPAGNPRPDVLVRLPFASFNRHGLVCGATGTGKTRTLQLLAEQLSAAGVAVFLTDIKGDLSGLCEAGTASDKLTARTRALGQEWTGASFSLHLYSLTETTGVPLRSTVEDFGALLLARALKLNDTQESALALVFAWAEQENLRLYTLEDLREVLHYLTTDGKAELSGIGGVSTATAGVILREVSALAAQGGDVFFQRPSFSPSELIAHEGERGVISALELPDVRDMPELFSTFTMWVLSRLFSDLPEVGDTPLPRLVFFFDEAHLLFSGASRNFVDEVTRVVRLIRSKGVGVFFVTQTPQDIPESVLAQLGTRIHHALRAHTPKDVKVLNETAKTFPFSPLDIAAVLPALGTGEAVVTGLGDDGAPTAVAPTRLWAPRSVMGPASPAALRTALGATPRPAPLSGEAASEGAARAVAERRAQLEAAAAAAKEAEEQRRAEEAAAKKAAREAEKKLAAAEREAERAAQRAQRNAEKEAERQARRRDAAIDSVVRSAGRSLGRSIINSIFGRRR
ncbi:MULTISPECIES: helicase HerA-like domain-containing protein [Actinotignum]|uniref:helicase HerA-like domain-containing protein n=1 Tax=Actinotignum TaxID=1653174 RepID=UPI00265AA884|nr:MULTISPECIES: helicase HerA-like domain-containing protein [Actinotignum]MDE1536558.1 DUF853 family protein [Actinotignum schaalii]MDY5143883.1 helicase HerA-like domain-containing protein [Actinotignum timonense]